jgi:predicted site-specific integrase-resolvase
MSGECENAEWLTVEQVAEILGLKPVTIKRYAREGLLNGTQEKNEWQFLSTDIDKFKEIQAKL